MKVQDYSNHRRFAIGYHFLLSTLLLAGTVIAIVNVTRHPAYSGGHVSSVLIALLFICCLLIFWLMRAFPLKAQDRSIRAEEALRFYVLTQKALDKRLTISQIIALRFAPDEEFVSLAERAAEENLSSDDIKKAIKQWKPDNYRV